MKALRKIKVPDILVDDVEDLKEAIDTVSEKADSKWIIRYKGDYEDIDDETKEALLDSLPENGLLITNSGE